MFENIGLSIQGIWNHKLRSLLTMLGIIIGIASIIAIVSTIKGTNEQIKEQLIGAGNNVVTVRLCQGSETYEMQYSGIPDGVPVLTEETRAKLADIDGAVDATLYNQRSWTDGMIYRGDTGFSGVLRGVDGHYFAVNGYDVYLGRDFSQRDFDRFSKVAILDQSAAAGTAALCTSPAPCGPWSASMTSPRPWTFRHALPTK